jgi:hypothetical protein
LVVAVALCAGVPPVVFFVVSGVDDDVKIREYGCE